MPLSLLADIAITKGLREALPFLEHLVGLDPEASARSILSAARAVGLSFSDGPAFNVVAQIKANIASVSRLNALGPDELPDIAELVRTEAPLKKNYAFVVKITGYNANTGEREERGVTVVSDELLTLNQVFSDASSLPTETPGSSPLANSTLELVRMYASPYAP